MDAKYPKYFLPLHPMGFRFRKSVSIFPGVRLNIGKKGLGVSAGVKGARVGIGSKGAYTSVGIPGTGISSVNYAGKGKKSKQDIALPCPAIIDRTLWQKAHDRLTHNKRFAKKNKLYEYLFSGKLVCGQCGSLYVGYMKKKSRKKKVIAMYGQYRCRRSSKAKAAQPCRNSHISERELDSKIWKQLYDFLSDPRRFIKELQQREAQAEGVVELRVKQEEVDADFKRLQGEYERVRFLYEKGIGYKSTQEVEERFAEIETERRKLREQEKAIASRILTREQQRDRIQCAEVLGERYKKVLDAADFQLKKQIINALVEKVTIHSSRVRVELRIEKPLTQEVKTVFAGKNEIQKPLYGAMGGTRTLNPCGTRF